MINNIRSSSIQKEKTNINEKNSSVGGSLGSSIDVLSGINPSITAQLNKKSSDTSKMIESLDVITTKSNLLNEIYSRSTTVDNFSKVSEGDLIKINNIKLKIVNQENLREFKLFRSDALNGLQVEGVEISNIFNSMLKDYAYILSGKLEKEDKVEVAIKIPMELENEFENKYTVDDLTVGKVSIVGIYKGVVNSKDIRINTITYLSSINEEHLTQSMNDKYVHSAKKETPILPIEQEQNYFYIDVIAIVQNISFEKEEDIPSLHIPWYKRLFKRNQEGKENG